MAICSDRNFLSAMTLSTEIDKTTSTLLSETNRCTLRFSSLGLKEGRVGGVRKLEELDKEEMECYKPVKRIQNMVLGAFPLTL